MMARKFMQKVETLPMKRSTTRKWQSGKDNTATDISDGQFEFEDEIKETI